MHLSINSFFLKAHPRLKIVIIVFVFLALLGCVGYFAYYRFWGNAVVTPPKDFTRLALITVSTQIALSVFTFLALCVSLWVAGFNRLIIGPSLILKTQFDDLHCVLSNDPACTPKPTQEPFLSLYVHVENLQPMSAEDCSVTCNRIYVSVDGMDFYKFRTIQTASFKWAYEKKEDPYVTTVRRTVEKYARIIEIRQQSTYDNSNFDKSSEATSPVPSSENVNPTSSQGGQNVSWFEVLLPSTSESRGTISVPSRYRALLLPISIVSKNTPVDPYFVKVVWKGDAVEKYTQAGFLQCSIVSESESRKLIKE